MNFMHKIFFLIFPALLFLSCSEDVDLLVEKGEYDRAIIILKEELSKDYSNTQLRNNITKLYFTNAKRNIRENDLGEAERNLERGIIYSDENNPEIKDEYAEILVLLGSNLIGSGDREGSVELKKKYEKGISLIKKSIGLTENNEKAKAILNAIKTEEAQRYFDLAKNNYELWTTGSQDVSLLTESRKNLELANEIMVVDQAPKLKNDLLAAFLTQNVRSNPYDLRLMRVFFNADNGNIALRIRFYNNSGRDIIVNPSQFTLYDNSDNPYKFDPVAAKRGNYRNILQDFRINPGRFLTGLLVFNTNIRRNPVMSKIVWTDDAGNTFAKEFPETIITDLELE